MTESASDNQSIYRFRWLGYGLLIFSLVDAIQVLVPLQLTNPAWELQTIGLLVERVTIPLLGIALVFFGESRDRALFEKKLLKFLSWLCLALAIFFLLMIPLGVLGTARIDAQTNQQINKKVEQQVLQLNQLEDLLNRGNAEEQKAVAAQLNRIGLPVSLENSKAIKDEGLLRISQARMKVQEQSTATRSEQQSTLFKSSVKWNLGALIASTLLFFFWRSTRWAR